MSHSNFKLINNDEPINSNLVIIVNKNGDVKTDTLALQNLLTSRETPETGVTVIRETSPTPSISDEIEEERAQQIELFRQQYIADHPNASEEEVEQQTRKIGGINNIPHVSLNVENFYAPDQARKFANDVLHLGGIENPSTLMPIDYNFRRQIVQNDHCYTPLTLSPKESTSKEPKKSKAKAAKEQPAKGKKEAKQSKARQSTSVKEEDEDSSNSGDGQNEEDEDAAEEEEQSEESFSETDDDNDMDFSVNDRFGKKGKKKRKYRRQKQKSMTFKDFLEGGGDMSSMDDEPKKKYGKSSKKAQNPRVSGKSMGPSTSKNTQQSTVRKLPNQTQQNKNAALKKEIQTPPLSSTPKSNNSTASTASSVIGQISIQSAAPAKSTQEIEFVESIVKDLEKSFPETDNKKAQIVPTTTTTTVAATNSIPNIMQMMETNTPTEVIDQSLSTLEHIADGHVGIEEIGDALIAALGNEAIDELLNQGDLMNFDATATTHVKPAQNIVTSSSGILSHTVSEPVLSDVTTSPLSSTVSSPLPKILNKQAPGKDPIKVVRNGRVITLPPIEAPATRGAKRRAQGDSTSPVGKVIKTENKTPSTKDPDSRNSSRRSSLNKSESGRNSRRQSTAQGNPEEDDEMNSDASWNSEDDPDRLWCICKQPHNNRFMICCDKCEDWFHGTCVNVTKAMGKDMERQDIKWHCPNCKSNAGAVKKDPNKKTLNQQKLTKFFSKHSKELTDEDVPKTSDSLMCAVCHKKPARTDSIYCSEDCIRNHATKHLDDNTQPKTPTTPTSTKPTAGDGKRGNVLKDQSGNVIVYDRVSGKLLSSKLWPHFTNLGQWLGQNPNCEPVKPGSHQATQLLSKVSKNAQQPTTPTVASPKEAITSTSSHPPTTLHTGTKHHHHHPPPIIPADELFSNPVKIHTGAKEVVTPPVLKKSMSVQNPAIARSNSNNTKSTPPTRPPLTKQTSVSSSTSSKSVPTPKVQHESRKLKRQASDEKPQTQSTPSNSKLKIEYERQNVRTNLKSTLIQRMKDIDSSVPKMKDEEIEKFATAIESEMFRFFNKDTRDKYKVKFRSLKFNLSDTKNKTLIERICMKKLTPKQLVELPSSELASKELSKWREEENKHQLEIITKAELDALAQTKMVIKTHKGEEILETKNTSADISLPEEDIESAIDKTVLSVEDPHHKYDLSRSISLNVSGNHSVSSPLSSPSISSSTGRKSESHHNDSHSRSRSKSRGREHHHHSHHKSSSKHKKSEHRHRSRSPKHHHSSHHHSRDKSHEREHHSRDKSREKSNERDHSKKRSEDHHHHHHRDKSRSNEKEKEREKTNSKSKDRETSKDSKKHHHTHNKDTKEAPVVVVKKEEQSKEKIIPEIKPEQKDVDIVGKILDSMGVHLDTKPKIEDEKLLNPDEIKSEVSSSSLINDVIPVSLDPVNEHQLEIEIYSGNMYMADVAKFDVTASVVSGNVDDIIKLFVPQMEIVGRIEPKTVWDYLGKVKKLPGKELAVIRFSSTDEAAYFSLFSYLHSRQRYGVIKSPAPNIKDFYLITVEAIRPLPPVLLPIVGPGFIEGDEHKPDLLLGVILKLTPEARHVQKKAPTMKKSAKTPKPVEHNVPIKILPTKHKPHSHCGGNKLTMGLPEVESGHMKSSPKTSPSSQDDEPYEPLDEDSLTPPQLYAQHKSAGQHHGHHGHHSASGGKLNASDDLESQMEQLNREIERRQMEIQTLAQQKALELDEEQASKIFEKIRVPHNLSEILSTIKASEPKPMEIDEDDDDEEYVPIAAATKGGMHEYRPSSSYPNVIQQQQTPIVNSMMDIDERINLFRQEMPMNNLPVVPEQPSRLASMSDADLLALVPEDALQAPPPPIISSNSISEPAIPGLEYEMEQ